MNLRRHKGGAKAKAFGNLFETIFERVCRRSSMVVTRVPDGCKQLRGNQIIRVSSPFDWIVSFGPRTALLDTKTLDNDRFAFSVIKDHQVREMAAHQKMSGNPAGYVIWLRPKDLVFYLNAITLLAMVETRGSLGECHADAILLGSSYDFQASKIFTGTQNKDLQSS